MRIVSKGLTYVYNKKTPFASAALEDVTVTIEEGEFFGIIGHTGSGKSTFIQHLNGLIPVDGGSLTVGGTNMKFYRRGEYRRIAPAEENAICFDEKGRKLRYGTYKKRHRAAIRRVRAGVGMVFQYPEYQLFGETVFQDVAFGIKNFFPEYDAERTERAVRDAVTRVGLDYEAVRDKSPFDLSGGQKRRVAIAGVIVTEPQVLVLDEPVAGLDPQGKKELMKLLHELHGTVCKTVVIVSHDMDEVAENCTRVAVFSEGKVLREDVPENLFRDAGALEAVGLDVPLTAKIASALAKIGVDIETDYTTGDFIAAVTEKYKK